MRADVGFPRGRTRGGRKRETIDSAARFLRERTGAAEVWLFGSRARGTATADSDVDFLLVFEDEADPVAVARLANDAAWDLSLRLDPLDVDVVTITRSAFYHLLKELHPASVSSACRTEGRRIL